MTMESVRERYGSPDEIIEEAPLVGTVRTGSGTARATVVERSTWIYRGDSTTLTTVIRFRNGQVESLHKQ
jgi:hypothetical protein